MSSPVSSSFPASLTSAANPETTPRHLVALFTARGFTPGDAEGLAQRINVDLSMPPEALTRMGIVPLDLRRVRKLELFELLGARAGSIKIKVNANNGSTNQWRVIANLTVVREGANDETFTTVLSHEEYNELHDLHMGRATPGAPPQMRGQ